HENVGGRRDVQCADSANAGDVPFVRKDQRARPGEPPFHEHQVAQTGIGSKEILDAESLGKVLEQLVGRGVAGTYGGSSGVVDDDNGLVGPGKPFGADFFEIFFMCGPVELLRHHMVWNATEILAYLDMVASRMACDDFLRDALAATPARRGSRFVGVGGHEAISFIGGWQPVPHMRIGSGESLGMPLSKIK